MNCVGTFSLLVLREQTNYAIQFEGVSYGGSPLCAQAHKYMCFLTIKKYTLSSFP